MVFLVNQGGSHNKFYVIHDPDASNNVVTVNGRLGTSGQKRTKQCASHWDANDFVKEQWHKKRRKGYETISEDALKILQKHAKMFGSSNKLSVVKWIKNPGLTEPNIRVSLEAVPQSALQDPNLEVALYAEFQTRKLYDGVNRHILLLTADKTYRVELNGQGDAQCKLLDEGHEMFQMVNKVGEVAVDKI